MGAMSAPMLAPVTAANSGRLPDSVQPASTPPPKAPSDPPPEIASHGPLACGSRRAKSFSESPHARASAMPGMAAASSSSSVNAVPLLRVLRRVLGGGAFFSASASAWPARVPTAHSSGGDATSDDASHQTEHGRRRSCAACAKSLSDLDSRRFVDLRSGHSRDSRSALREFALASPGRCRRSAVACAPHARAGPRSSPGRARSRCRDIAAKPAGAVGALAAARQRSR